MQSVEKISITLPPDMLQLLRDAVEGGEYASTSEALRNAVRAWHRQRLETPSVSPSCAPASRHRSPIRAPA